MSSHAAFNLNAQVNASIASEIIIGEYYLIGPNVVIRTAGHNYLSMDVPIRKQGHSISDIVIEDDVWNDSNVVISGGVNIEAGG